LKAGQVAALQMATLSILIFRGLLHCLPAVGRL
jgi:hypothetical protein